MYEMLDARDRKFLSCWLVAMLILYPIVLIMTLSEAHSEDVPIPQVFWPWCFSSHPFQTGWKHEGGERACYTSARLFIATIGTLVSWIPFISAMIHVRSERRMGGERRENDDG